MNGAPWHKECHAASKRDTPSRATAAAAAAPTTAVRRGGAAAGPRVAAGNGGDKGASKPAERVSALRAVTTGARGKGQARGRSAGRSVASARVATLGLALDYASLE